MLELTPSEAKLFITNALKIRKIPYIAGPAGIGKSDLYVQVADDFNLMLLDIRLSQKLPEDLTGLPRLNEKTGKAEYTPFDTFPMEGDDIPDGYDGWLVFLDELSSASDEVWSAIYSLLLGHTVGGRRLHSKALICAAGNRALDSAIARMLPDTLITRMLTANMKVSSKDWIIWAKEPVNNINTAVIDFITKNPDMLMSTIPSSSREELESYGTPRGWATVSLFTNLHEKIHKPVSTKSELTSPTYKARAITEDISHVMTSAVGYMEAKAFIDHFNEQMVVPHPWEVAQSASSVRIPTSAIARAELTEELAKHFIEVGAQGREALLLYINRNDSEIRTLFCTLIEQALGETISDKALLEDINKRLMVDKGAPLNLDDELKRMDTQDDDTSIVLPNHLATTYKPESLAKIVPSNIVGSETNTSNQEYPND